MKKLLNYLLLLSFIGLAMACARKPVTNTKSDIKKLSELSKKTLDDASEIACKCIKEYHSDLKATLEKTKLVLTEAEKSGNTTELMVKIAESMSTIEGFERCMRDASPGKGNKEAEKALNEDMKKIMNENSDFDAVDKKRKEIILAFLKKNCSGEAKILEDFFKLEDDARALVNKKKDGE